MSKSADPVNSHESYAPIDTAYYNEIICMVLSHLVQQNEGIEMSPELTRSYSTFATQWGYDWATVEEYVSRLQEWIVCGPECFVIALCLMKRLESLSVVPPITQRTVHRAYFTSLVLAVKFVEDETLCNADFAKVGCVTVNELNRMERRACVALKFNCTVTLEDYEQMKADLEQLSAMIRRKSKSSKISRETALTFTALCSDLAPGGLINKKSKFRFSFARSSKEKEQQAKEKEKEQTREKEPQPPPPPPPDVVAPPPEPKEPKEPKESRESKPSLFRRSTKSFIRGTSRFSLHRSSASSVDINNNFDADAPIVCNAPTSSARRSGHSEKSGSSAAVSNATSKHQSTTAVVFFPPGLALGWSYASCL